MNARVKLSVVIIILGFPIIFMQAKKFDRVEVLDNKVVAAQFASGEYLVTIDEVIAAIVNADPSYQLIDVRSATAYGKNGLPTALNIPVDSVINEEWLDLFDEEYKKFVLYSTDDEAAQFAWRMLKKLNYKNIFVMAGGLKNFNESLKNLTPPEQTASVEEHNHFLRRKAAAQYFFGSDSKSVVKKKASPRGQKRKKKKAVEGGCG